MAYGKKDEPAIPQDGTTMEYEIYTDGGYSMPDDLGAFAYVILQDGREISRYSQKIVHETNNRAELKAIIYGVLSLPQGSKIKVYSDSRYAIGVLSGYYSAKANTDLILPFWEDVKEGKYKVKYNWVKGHSGNKWNELCDSLCDKAAGLDLNAWTDKFKEKKGKSPLERITDLLEELTLGELDDLYSLIEEKICYIEREIRKNEEI